MIVDRDTARQDGTARAEPEGHLIRRPGMPPRTAQRAVVFRADIPGSLLRPGGRRPAWQQLSTFRAARLAVDPPLRRPVCAGVSLPARRWAGVPGCPEVTASTRR